MKKEFYLGVHTNSEKILVELIELPKKLSNGCLITMECGSSYEKRFRIGYNFDEGKRIKEIYNHLEEKGWKIDLSLEDCLNNALNDRVAHLKVSEE